MSCFVGNLEDRFCHIDVHILIGSTQNDNFWGDVILWLKAA